MQLKILLCTLIFVIVFVLVLVLVLVFSGEGYASDSESRVVNIASGPIRGHKDPVFDIFTFHGIPYATAPSGPHKFRAPLPEPVWQDTLDAVDRGIICPQSDIYGLLTDKTMQEDCLIANVYVPDTDETNLPVVVYVHGGAYQTGHGNLLQAKHLVQSKKIIFVNFNYRLSAHGFLCLGTEDIPGNAGMKDQVALLRWVKKNIASFGGNPNDVTIHGSSAGSSAVDLLMLSKMARGLFNKVIPESGANVGVWSVQIDPLKVAKDHAKKLNFTNVEDIYALEEFFTTTDMKLLTQEPYRSERDSTFALVPCVERQTGGEIFLDDAPVNILKSGQYDKLPMLYGFSNMEGLFRVVLDLPIFSRGMNEKFSDFLPADLQFDSEEEKENVAREVKEFYFGEEAVGEETIQEYIDYYGDIMFAYSTLRAVKLHNEAGHDKIYLYEYSFAAQKDKVKFPSYVNDLLKRLNVTGANHCAQTEAVLDGMGAVVDESILSEEYREVKAVMRELWLNFMTTGAPVPEGSQLPAWPPTGADGAPYMSLDRSLHLGGPLLERRARFWHQIYEKHYRTPVPPPSPPSPLERDFTQI